MYGLFFVCLVSFFHDDNTNKHTNTHTHTQHKTNKNKTNTQFIHPMSDTEEEEVDQTQVATSFEKDVCCEVIRVIARDTDFKIVRSTTITLDENEKEKKRKETFTASFFSDYVLFPCIVEEEEEEEEEDEEMKKQ